MILVDLINFVICLLPLLIFITLVLVLNLITTYTVNWTNWVHPFILMVTNTEMLYFAFIQYWMPGTRICVGSTQKSAFTWFSNSTMILHKIYLRCHVSPEKDVSYSPWDASLQGPACWLQCFEPGLCLEDSYAFFTIWVWNPPHRLLRSFLVWAGRCYLEGSEIFGEWGLPEGSKLWGCVFCGRHLSTLHTPWYEQLLMMFWPPCSASSWGPELMEPRTMHWNIWNCELR